ncbi:hypothetical protein BN1708_013661 [Verticillium longisporum]|uniref:Replication factor C C-terminal domain-containing protein n=1 Tax=Verticillium longisporum TaxID=100787 RepID=A0A0G4LMZ2_VERLO|nr:hypothetical protein BN1708_013661 [Verticillium longisporum]
MASFFDLKARKQAAANGASSQKQDKSSQPPRAQPWVEKYRPKTLSDVTAQDHTVTILQRTLQASNVRTGKTSTVLALAKELYGPELIKTRVLELNASDERGISIVREKVKNFARMQLTNPTAEYKKRYPCPPFKIIILRFKSLDQGNAKRRLEEIAKNEGVELEEGAVDALIKCSEGDLRKAITFLQSAARLVGATENADGDQSMDVDKKPITVKIIEDIAGVIPESTINKLTTAIRPQKSGDMYQNVAGVVEEMVADGWSAGQIVSQLYQHIVYDEAIPDVQKNKIVLIFSEVDKRLVDGADEHLSILDLSLRISGIMAGRS